MSPSETIDGVALRTRRLVGLCSALLMACTAPGTGAEPSRTAPDENTAARPTAGEHAAERRQVTHAGLVLDVPDGFADTVDRGPDFEVLRVTEITDDDDGGAWLGIYVGMYPSFTRGPTPSMTRELLGQPVAFYDQRVDGTRRREALIEQGGLSYHLFYGASDDEGLRRVDAIASSLRFVTQ